MSEVPLHSLNPNANKQARQVKEDGGDIEISQTGYETRSQTRSSTDARKRF